MMKSADHVVIYSSSAIILRRIEYGDYDYILTFITPYHGKVSVIAKNAKKSVKRFSGSLELFYGLNVVIREGRSVSFLEEVYIEKTFSNIRSDIMRTAYACYWSEIIVQWIEEGTPQKKLYDLLEFALDELDKKQRTPEEISIIFQMKFLEITGFLPELTKCGQCSCDIDAMTDIRLVFDVRAGWLLCNRCKYNAVDGITLSKGTLKKMLWLCDSDIEKTLRIKFTGHAIQEALKFLEAFLPYHLEKEVRSLNFLRKMRNAGF